MTLGLNLRAGGAHDPKFTLLFNLDRSEVSHFQPTWSEENFENSAQVGQNYFLPVDISLENVLTGREKFSATVEICLLKF